VSAVLIKGKPLADRIRAQVAEEVRELGAIGLVTVLVGDDPASQIYIRLKQKAAEEVGIHPTDLRLPADITEDELLEQVARLGSDEEVDAMLVQLPLPDGIDEARVLSSVAPLKDADGLHPFNAGQLFLGRPTLVGATPLGIMALLAEHRIELDGARAVVVGRSDIVGKPVALLLLHEHATVTICHSKTPDLPAVCREADILVAAMGRPAMITGDFIKPGATVIDVGTTRVEDRAEIARIFRNSPEKLAAFEKRGGLLVGDVHPLDVLEKAGAYTPVPGGVGPLTIAMLMANTVASAEARCRQC
jgi:methylenetetrahydrofolate dehydrogenase (NADP+)/methenyltetrahydrofolate cyclohydrolase